VDGGEEIVGSLLDPALVGDVVRRLVEAGIDEFELADGVSRLYIKRSPGAGQVEVALAASSPVAREEVDEGVPIPAPLTGVYYARPAPDQPLFVTVGGAVHVDDVVALIETMKLFNEVKSEIAGRVTRVVAAEGDLVQAGQPLMFVAPTEEEA
jgi:acetyl-CoA carboxylase biotin carboxyl carrier protein